MRINTVYVLYLQFTDAHFASAYEIMKTKVLSKMDFAHLHWITIDNSVTKDVEIVKNHNFHFISGDNSSREFSGYEKGIKYLNRLKPNPRDLVIFANDTFHRSYGHAYLESISEDKIKSVIQTSAVLGYVDSFPQPVRGFNYEFKSWIRTSFFMQSFSLVHKLIPFVLPVDRSAVFGDSPGEFFKANTLLSENYKTYLKTWLYENESLDSEFKESWHSKVKLTEGNLKMLQEKCWCILCEQNLSARAREKGIPIVSIN